MKLNNQNTGNVKEKLLFLNCIKFLAQNQYVLVKLNIY